ncbi:hypothetical protein [[Limnothrix rosea] IAM M-220]|uniref:hypothetical protein n=1 Tax=[Limnothrix rosea] IAM M-220 TaxID=454133 RepID=UPI00095FF8FE|nr:hypothetical protein [[Limnothrix rosea] IAM M-220]OKH19404.1 hypothetical protein NIES208_02510 [[Limnothrix rosea] IAM M-220]
MAIKSPQKVALITGTSSGIGDKKIKDAIPRRPQASQVDSTPTEVFAKQLVNAAAQSNFPAILRLGKKSFYLPFLHGLLPTHIFDIFANILANKFSLNPLKWSLKAIALFFYGGDKPFTITDTKN